MEATSLQIDIGVIFVRNACLREVTPVYFSTFLKSYLYNYKLIKGMRHRFYVRLG